MKRGDFIYFLLLFLQKYAMIIKLTVKVNNMLQYMQKKEREYT